MFWLCTVFGTVHRDVMKEFDVEKILSGIYYFRCHDHIQLIALVHTLDDFMSKHDKVGVTSMTMSFFKFLVSCHACPLVALPFDPVTWSFLDCPVAIFVQSIN